MKKLFIFSATLILLGLGGLVGLNVGSGDDLIVEPTVTGVFLPDFGVSFSRPVGSRIVERDLSEGSRVRYSVVIGGSEDQSQSEGSPEVTVDIFSNDVEGYTAERFATTSPYSNWKLGNGALRSITVGEERGVEYSWSGLYEGTSIVIARPHYVYVLSMTWSTPSDPTFLGFDLLKNSLVFSPDSNGLWRSYGNKSHAFEARIPSDFIVDESYFNYNLGPGREIPGVSFVVSPSITEGTNLSGDSRVSIKRLARAGCTPADFIRTTSKGVPITLGSHAYVYATTSDAAAGNRYDEAVYVIKKRDTCYGVHFFIHYAEILNYPKGSRVEFDRSALISTFKKIAGSLSFI